MRRAASKANLPKSFSKLVKDTEPHPTQSEIFKTSRLKRFASKAKLFKSSTPVADLKPSCADEIKSSHHDALPQRGIAYYNLVRVEKRAPSSMRRAVSRMKRANSTSLKSTMEGKSSKIPNAKHGNPSPSSETSSWPAVKTPTEATLVSDCKRFPSKFKFFGSSASNSKSHPPKDAVKLSVMRRIAAKAKSLKSKFKSISEKTDSENELIQPVNLACSQQSKLMESPLVTEKAPEASSDKDSDDSGEDWSEYSSDEVSSDDSTDLGEPSYPCSVWAYVPWVPQNITKKMEPLVENPRVECIPPSKCKAITESSSLNLKWSGVKKWVRPKVKPTLPECTAEILPIEKLCSDKNIDSVSLLVPQASPQPSVESMVEGQFTASRHPKKPVWYDDLSPLTRRLIERDVPPAQCDRYMKIVSGEKYRGYVLTGAEVSEIENEVILCSVLAPYDSNDGSYSFFDPEEGYPFLPTSTLSQATSPYLEPFIKSGEACADVFGTVAASTSKMFNAMFSNFYSKKDASTKKTEEASKPITCSRLSTITA